MAKLRVLDLFSGIGGFSLGLERTGGFETVAFCEIEEFPRKVLRKHWPEVPIYEDVLSLRPELVRTAKMPPVDVITGGFPCQPFSTASRGRRVAVDLWPQMARVIEFVRPRFVIGENVARKPIEHAAEFCRGLGMHADTIRLSAHDCGADHRRNRWWFVAHPHEGGKLRRTLNAKVAELPKLCRGLWGSETYRSAICVSDGVSSGLVDAGLFGNAVIPQIPEMIGHAILEAEAA